MIFSQKEELEDSVLRQLFDDSMTAKQIQNKLKDENILVTFQGVYKVLKALIEKEVLIKRGLLYLVNEEWRELALKSIKSKEIDIALVDMEKISYSLSSLVHLDMYWKSIMIPFHRKFPHDPIFLYSHHQLWFHLDEKRKESEYAYHASFANNKTHAFCLLGENTIHEQIVKKEIQSEYLQVATGHKCFSEIDNPIIFRDYIITTKIDKDLARRIHECYTSTGDTFSLEKELKKLGIEKKKIKLVIERNKEKAKRLRKKMSRDFYIPKELIRKYDLF